MHVHDQNVAAGGESPLEGIVAATDVGIEETGIADGNFQGKAFCGFIQKRGAEEVAFIDQYGISCFGS